MPHDQATPPRTHTGLTLSGGGFRATLFHLGVVRYLYEEKILGTVTHITSVSGGSILAAHLLLHWERYTSPKAEEFNAAAKELVDFVRCDVRGRVIRPWLVSFLAAGLPRVAARLVGDRPRWWRTSLLQRTYDRLYRGRRLMDLEAPGRPQLHLLATSFTTGHLVTFGQCEMRFCGEQVPEPEFMPADEVPVSLAVAASSAFPPLFPPVRVDHTTFGAAEDMFPNRHYLTDGGVFDNLGIHHLLGLFKQERLDTLFVSDAQRSLAKEYGHEYNLMPGRATRCVDLMMDRVSWFVSAAAHEAIDLANGTLVYCGLPKRPEHALDQAYAPSPPEQFAVATARTDLDAFTDDEIDAIVHQGYAAARAAAEAKGLSEPWPTGRPIWHPARPARVAGYQLAGIDRRKWGLFRASHWATWALWGLVGILIGIPVAMYAYQYFKAVEQRQLKEEAERRLQAAERAAQYVKAVRVLGEMVLSGNVQSAERRRGEWDKLRQELEMDPAFSSFLACPELRAVEAVELRPDGPRPFPPGTERLVLTLAKAVRADLERSGGEPFLEVQRSSRVQLYDEVREAVEQIASREKMRLDQVPNSRRQFWRLYWGPMAMVEGAEVERAMVAFGNVLQQWEESNRDATPGLKAKLQEAERGLLAAIRAELAR